MTKEEAIVQFVQLRFDPVPTEWVRIVAEHLQEFPALPMWGTMWQIERYWGEMLMSKARIVDPETEEYNQEMAGSYNVLDVTGQPTAVYVYEIDGRYLIGVHGAGWDFYDGVWDMLYDLFGLVWHIEETELYSVAV